MLTIVKPGLLTTIQDLGRYGWQKYGIVVSGAMDPIAHRLANILVMNDENCPTLEMTLVGATLRFEENTVIALTGADMSPRLNGRRIPIGTAIAVEKGDVLEFGIAEDGCRTYLAVHGGFDVPRVFKSSSTYLRAGFGGFKGRTLEKGDRIKRKKTDSTFFQKVKNMRRRWAISRYFYPPRSRTVRVMKGRQFQLFTKESQQAFFREPFTVTSDSDRMGYRLTGPTLSLTKKFEMISEGVAFGSIQVPASGDPIVLLADRQTVGGYPKIAQIATVDFSTIAQKKPGDEITFSEITVEEAQMLIRRLETEMRLIKASVRLQFR